MRKLVFPLIVAAIFSSCTFFMGHQNVATTPSNMDIAAFQKHFMSSYYAERASGKPDGTVNGPRALTPFTASHVSGARTTVPVSQLTNPLFSSLAPLTFTDYPEPGQNTSFTATYYGPNPDNSNTNIWDIVVTTVFASTDARQSYVEEYYVNDITVGNTYGNGNGDISDGTWTIDDFIVAFRIGHWVVDPTARVRMLLTYQDGSTRNETIVSSSLSTSPGPKFDITAFSLAGSMDLSQSFVPLVASDPNVMYSSVVVYTCAPSTAYSFWFWQGNVANSIVGVRYYTEYADTATSHYVGYTASFEKAVESLTTTGGSYATTMQTIFAGSQSTVLAESVLRQKVDFQLAGTAPTGTDYYRAAGSALDITTNMQTRVVNIAGQKDFYLQQLNSDFVQLSSWANSTIYIPTGNATEILATTPGALALGRITATTAVAGGQPLATSSTIPGLGEVGTVYTSIVSGAAASPVSPTTPTPASNVMPANTEWTFNGENVEGTLAPVGNPVLKQSGTVEAWLYINTMTDTMGIVHKGTHADFSDEAYSLQGWGAGGQIAMIVDQNGVYDAAFSDINLNTGKWYYIVGIWDVTGGNRYIQLYINGVLHGSGTPNVIYPSGTSDSTSVGMMVGSQLPVAYDATWGYFGVNGKIVGVNVTPSAMSPTAILAKYNANVGFTSSW
jgi:hypothetical protein